MTSFDNAVVPRLQIVTFRFVGSAGMQTGAVVMSTPVHEPISPGANPTQQRVTPVESTQAYGLPAHSFALPQRWSYWQACPASAVPHRCARSLPNIWKPGGVFEFLSETVPPTVTTVPASAVMPASGVSVYVWQYGLHGLSVQFDEVPEIVRTVAVEPEAGWAGGGASAVERSPVGLHADQTPPTQVAVPRAQSTMPSCVSRTIPQLCTSPSVHGPLGTYGPDGPPNSPFEGA